MLKTPAPAAMTNAEYHSHPAIGKSHLDAMAKSPRHYWARYLDPQRKPEPASPALILGSAVHALVLEPETFRDLYVQAPKVDRRTTDGKAAWAAFEKQAAGKTVLDADQWATVHAIQTAVIWHQVAGNLLGDGEAERTVMTTDPETGLPIKCRPDWLRNDGIVVDLKTTEDASPTGFAKSIANFRYHVQAAWYIDTMREAFGEAPAGFVFVAVEKRPPYAIGVYRLDVDSVAAGSRLARRDLRAIAHHASRNDWPDYTPKDVETISLPRWAF